MSTYTVDTIKDDLDGLTDKQIREKCLYYGLQNVPINGETRQIIINKIRQHVAAESSRNEKIKGRQVKLLTLASRNGKGPDFVCNLREERNVSKFKLKTKQMSDHQILGADILQRIRTEDKKKQKMNQQRDSELKKAEEESLAIAFEAEIDTPHQVSSTSLSENSCNSRILQKNEHDYCYTSESESDMCGSPCQSTETFYSVRSRAPNYVDH